MIIDARKTLIVLYLFNMIVLDNGSSLSKILKLSFFAFIFIYFLIVKFPIKWKKYYNWQLIFTIYILCSHYWAFNKSESINGISTILLNTLLVALLLQILQKNDEILILKCFMCLPALLFLRLFLSYGTYLFYGLRNLPQHNTIGMYGGLGAAFSIYYIKKYNCHKYVSVFILNFAICMISMSRKGFLFLLLPLFFAMLFSGNTIQRKIKYFFLIIFLSSLCWFLIMNVPIIYDYIGKGFESAINYFINSTGDKSVAGRNTRIELGLRKFSEKPLLGWGARNYNYLYDYYIESISGMNVADNNYIDILVNFGIIGLVIYYSKHLTSIISYIRYGSHENFILTFPFACLLTLIINDYGISSYLYLHSQTILALIIFMMQINYTKFKDSKGECYG